MAKEIKHFFSYSYWRTVLHLKHLFKHIWSFIDWIICSLSIHSFFKKIFSSLCVHMRVYVHTCMCTGATVCMGRPEDSLLELVLFFYLTGPRDQSQLSLAESVFTRWAILLAHCFSLERVCVCVQYLISYQNIMIWNKNSRAGELQKLYKHTIFEQHNFEQLVGHWRNQGENLKSSLESNGDSNRAYQNWLDSVKGALGLYILYSYSL